LIHLFTFISKKSQMPALSISMALYIFFYKLTDIFICVFGAFYTLMNNDVTPKNAQYLLKIMYLQCCRHVSA
jgi:hypothetical protein